MANMRNDLGLDDPLGDDEREALREAIQRARGHADYFWWHERVTQELGVAADFLQAATSAGEPGFPFSELRSRGIGNDPPDCEARDREGRRVAIEITELTDQDAIRAAKTASRAGEQVSLTVGRWNRARFLQRLEALLQSKDSKVLQGGPYAEYLVVVHTDEWDLTQSIVLDWLSGHRFTRPDQIARAYLLLSYSPALGAISLVRLPL